MIYTFSIFFFGQTQIIATDKNDNNKSRLSAKVNAIEHQTKQQKNKSEFLSNAINRIPNPRERGMEEERVSVCVTRGKEKKRIKKNENQIYRVTLSDNVANMREKHIPFFQIAQVDFSLRFIIYLFFSLSQHIHFRTFFVRCLFAYFSLAKSMVWKLFDYRLAIDFFFVFVFVIFFFFSFFFSCSFTLYILRTIPKRMTVRNCCQSNSQQELNYDKFNKRKYSESKITDSLYHIIRAVKKFKYETEIERQRVSETESLLTRWIPTVPS